MTIGSPLASCSGPAVLDTKEICLLSGDQAIESPDVGSGWFVPLIGAMNRALPPSALANISPWRWPSDPMYATRPLSGDHRGLEAPPSGDPSRIVCRVAMVITQACAYGR